MSAQNKRRIITVVFDRALKSALEAGLTDGRYTVEHTADGLDAFHRLAKNYFDLVITDFRMPGLDGVYFLPRLKRIQPWARVIVVPTKRVLRREREILESSSDLCLEKPLQMSQLQKAIQKIFAAADQNVVPGKKDWKSGPLSWEVG